MTPIGIPTTTGRYLPGYRLETGEAVTLPDAHSLPHYWAARDVAGHVRRALVAQAADLVAADPDWTSGWERAHAEAAALLEGAPMLPEAVDLAEMVLEVAGA